VSRTHGPNVDTVVFGNVNQPGELAAATSYAPPHGAVVIALDPSRPVDPTSLAWFNDASGQVDNVVAADGAGSIPPNVVDAYATANSGPLGVTTAPLPDAR
jgi:hypothetical protein